MQRVLINKNKNRLYLRLSKMTNLEMADTVIEIANAVKGLKPGFTCLTELKGLIEPTEKEKRMARLVMEYLAMMGVSKVVRVGAESILEVMDQNSWEVGKYNALRANTIEEAEALLDELSQRR